MATGDISTLEGMAPYGCLLLLLLRAGGLQPPGGPFGPSGSHPPGLATQQQARDIDSTDLESPVIDSADRVYKLATQ